MNPQANPLVIAVTVNWKQPADTLECLRSLSAQTYPRLRLLAVDNASGDGSAEQIRRAFPQAEVLESPSNLGFAGGYNLGIRRALELGADYVFIINNDATAHPRAVEHLLAQAAGAGMIAPLIFYAAEPQRVWSAGGWVSRWNLEVSFLADSLSRRYPDGRLPPAIELDFITGCAILLPRQTLESVGLFDEGYWMYYEDSDLSLRVRRLGLSIRLAPEAHAWHKVATSSGGRDTPGERYWMARSSVRFFRKHARGVQVPIVWFWRTGSAFRTTLRLALARRWPALRAYWRGLRDGLRNNPAGGPPPAGTTASFAPGKEPTGEGRAGVES